MTISVAMCTYNGGRFLEEQLTSIAVQTLLPSELVVCDDGSSDSTEEVVKAFADRVPFPVRFHRNTVNLGSTANFEQAIQLCHGDLIALCDQDDVWGANKLRQMAEVFNQQPDVAGVFTNAKLIDEHGQTLPGTLWKKNLFSAWKQRKFHGLYAPLRLVQWDTVTGATFMFRASYIPQFLPISREWVHDGWIALILASVAKLHALPECVMSYRIHASQQVGAREVAWHEHLSTEKEKAVKSHRYEARRLLAIKKKLEGLSVDPTIVQAIRKRLSYLERRTNLLEAPPLQRIIPAFGLLPGYFRYHKGIMSMLRDLLH